MSNINLYKPRGRPSKAVAEERVKIIAELLMQGKTRRYIEEFCVEKFGVALSSCDRLIHRANQYILQNYKEDPAVVVNKHIAMYYGVYEEWKGVDGKTAISALNSIEKLLKLHNPDTLVQQNTLNLNLDKLSINQLKELLNNED